jgi:hypothetical protein
MAVTKPLITHRPAKRCCGAGVADEGGTVDVVGTLKVAAKFGNGMIGTT